MEGVMILMVQMGELDTFHNGWQHLPPSFPHRRGVVTAVDAESRMPGRSALSDSSKARMA
jgi:hypothetical protein